MSLLDDVTILTTAAAGKATKLYSIKPTSGLADLTVTRATTATRVNSLGVPAEVVAVNMPQLDWEIGSCPSFLVEPQRTNLAFPSAVAVTHTVTTANIPYTLSFYGTGTVTLSGTYVATLNGTGATDRVNVILIAGAGALTMTVTGTVTNIQLEDGGYPTSCIITTGGSVTRNKTTFLATGLASILNPLEGVLFLEIAPLTLTPGTSLITISNGIAYAGGDWVGVGWWTNTWWAAARMNGLNIFWDSSIAPNADLNFHKIAMKYKSLYSPVFIDGVLMNSWTNSGTPSGTALDRTESSFAGTNSLGIFGRIKSIQYYNSALTDAQLINLTTP